MQLVSVTHLCRSPVAQRHTQVIKALLLLQSSGSPAHTHPSVQSCCVGVFCMRAAGHPVCCSTEHPDEKGTENKEKIDWEEWKEGDSQQAFMFREELSVKMLRFYIRTKGIFTEQGLNRRAVPN